MSLYDLNIIFVETDDPRYHIRYALEERAPYPPDLQVEEDTIGFGSQTRQLGGHEKYISRDLFKAVTQALDLERKTLLEYGSLPSPGEASFLDQMGEVGGALFGESEEPLLQLLQEGPGHWRPAVRITVSSEIYDRTLGKFPWEFLPQALPQWEKLWQKCIILRRDSDPELAIQHARPLSFPLTVSIHKQALQIQDVPGWGDHLLGGFAQQVRAIGGLEWSESLDTPSGGEVHHIVYNSREIMANRGQGAGTELLFLDQIYDLPDLSSLPRLLVLHDISADIPTRLSTHLLYEALSWGVDVVLLASFDQGDISVEHPFFGRFYRKLLHNMSIDQCVRVALQDSTGMPYLRCALAAREDGELSLLLTRTLLETVQQAVLPVLHQEPVRPDPLRQTRWIRKLQGQLQHIARDQWRDMLHHIEDLSGSLTFESEAWDLERAVQEMRQLGANIEEIRRGGTSLAHEALDQAGHWQKSLATIEQMAPIRFEGAIETQEHFIEEAGILPLSDAALERVSQAVRGQLEELAGRLEREEMDLESMEPERGPPPLLDDILEETDVSLLQPDPVRLTNLWLTEEVAGKVREVTADQVMVAQSPYTLHLQIGHRVASAMHAVLFPDHIVREVLREHGRVDLEVVLFSPKDHFAVSQRHSTLTLPAFESSKELQLVITPQNPGLRQLRVCIYYQNVLLQSMVLQACVISEGAEPPEDGRVTFLTDYVASTDLTLLEELPVPDLSIFTNQTPQGDHWLGVFAAGESAKLQLRSGAMHTFANDNLKNQLGPLREILQEISDRVPYTPPWDDFETYFVKLAIAGWNLYHFLFQEICLPGGDNQTDHSEDLSSPSVVSIARCHLNCEAIPWGGLYDLYLDTEQPDLIELCSVFKGQLAGQQDLLDDPEACRKNGACPLAGEEEQADLTVCPFGFWGFLHQIGQPLQFVDPTPINQLPEEIKKTHFNETSFLVSAQQDKLRLVFATGPGLDDVEDHRREIESLSDQIEVVSKDDRQLILREMRFGGYHFYYFYCHGDVEDDNFKLRLESGGNIVPITAKTLDRRKYHWRVPQPLVILNGCETVADKPNIVNGFLSTLRNIGASGIVGSEVEIYTSLARTFGCSVLEHMLGGQSVGQAFLKVRRQLLRQYNPLGLVYTLHAPATLHLHDETSCAWCKTYLPPKDP